MIAVVNRRVWIYGALLLGALGVVTAMLFSSWSTGHVLYYTGDPGRTDRRCLTCHVYANGGTLLDRLLAPRYLTPLDIAVSAAGDRLYVTAQDADRLLEVDPNSRRVLRQIPVGRRPHSVVLSPDGARAYVTNQYGNNVAVVGIASGRVLTTLAAGNAPAGIALDATGGRVFVANWIGNDISILGIASGQELARLEGGGNPNAVAVSPDGARMLVTNQLSYIVPYPGTPVSEVTLVDLNTERVEQRIQIRNAHMIEGVAFTPGGDYALALMVQPKNLLPALQVERGWMMVTALAVIDLHSLRVSQWPLDDVDRFYADPAGIVIDREGRYAFVSHGGVDQVSVVDLQALLSLVRASTEAELVAYANDLGVSRLYVRKRIAVGSNPRGLAISPDGKRVYVAERLDDRIGIIDTGLLQRTGEIDLGGPRHVTVARRGAKVFHSASNTLQQQFSCRSCHADQHVDRLQYDLEPDGLGMNVIDNRSLRGLRGTAPFKWNGKNTSLYMQCGIRFARFLTRSEPFSPDQLYALVAFITSQEAFPNPYRAADGALTQAQASGKAIFERTALANGSPIPEIRRCTTCHPGPLFTDRKRTDVGTQFPGDSAAEVDVPHLNDVWMSAPYLHNGRARTLEEIWTVYSPKDTHGAVADLGKEGLNNLVEYLKTL